MLLTTADLAARRGRADDARAALRQGLKTHPDDMDLRLALATLDLKTEPADRGGGMFGRGKRGIKGEKAGP